MGRKVRGWCRNRRRIGVQEFMRICFSHWWIQYGTLAISRRPPLTPTTADVQRLNTYDRLSSSRHLHPTVSIIYRNLNHDNILAFNNPYDDPTGQTLIAKLDNFGGTVIGTKYAPSQSLKFGTFPYKAPTRPTKRPRLRLGPGQLNANYQLNTKLLKILKYKVVLHNNHESNECNSNYLPVIIPEKSHEITFKSPALEPASWQPRRRPS
jgi:hypothetical protein